MLERILISGSGGQGIVLLGKLLAQVALRQTPHVTCFPSYGAEVRGGTSSCQVMLSTREISSPVAETFDSMVLMTPASVQHFLPRLSPDGLAVINRSLCKTEGLAQAIAVPATEAAESLGDVRAANLVMLGALVAHRKVVPPTDVEAGIRDLLKGRPARLMDINIKAFRIGLKA